VVGEEGLSATDRLLLRFGERMDREFIHQADQRRTLEETFDIGWSLLSSLPDETLVRLSDSQIGEHITPRRDA
jgi:V/A-type H+-transporting ATPase subunit B